MKIIKSFIFLLAITSSTQVFSQDMTALVQKVKAKLDKINDYVADGKMKTDVTFIKAPVGNIKVYYKKPDKFKLKRDGGISILPKGGVTLNMGSIVSTNDFDVIPSGEEVVGGIKTKKVKLLPRNENSDVVLTTLFIDEANLVIKKAITTTKENGTYQVEMTFGKYIAYGLPDKLVFSFNTKDYKVPKGITLEFDEAEKQIEAQKLKNKKGSVEITYTSYTINQGVADNVFTK